MHDMATAKTPQRFSRFKHCLIAYGALSLQRTRDTLMILIVYRYAGIAPHAVTKIDAQPRPKAANIAKRTVINSFARIVIIKITNRTMIFCERSALRFAKWINTRFSSRLEGPTSHTEDFRYCISI